MESSKGDGQLTACEVILFHHEDMGIPREIAKFGIRQGMWGAVKNIERGLRLYQKERASGAPLSRSAVLAQINTKINPDYMKSLEISEEDSPETEAYFEEYDYRVRHLQKKQLREEVKRLRELKKNRGKDGQTSYDGYAKEAGDEESGSPSAVAVPLPDMTLPPSFDGENHTYRYLSVFFNRKIIYNLLFLNYHSHHCTP